MKKRLIEESVLFVSIMKWVLLATLAGIIVGAATAFFLRLLALLTGISGKYPHYYLLLPWALFVSSLLVKYLAPDAKGHGTEKVIEAVHRCAGRISPLVVPVKLMATLVTLALGGSAGKEGPCAQIGAGLTSILADLFRFDDCDRRKLVICGISAGFASVFGTPIAGAIFGVEVLFIGAIEYGVLLPSFIAGVTAYHMSSSLGVSYFHQALIFKPLLTEAFVLKFVLAGIFFGICSILLIEMLHLGEKISAKLRLWEPLKGIIGGILLIILTFLFSTYYLGLGLDTIETCLQGGKVPWYAFLLKMLFTSITLNFGGSGGIITPIFFIGAAAGVTFANLLGWETAVFAAVGFVSVLAGAANTPIAASIMAVEIFGPAVAPYACIACVISFLMTGHRSVYPSQILSMQKSRSINVEMGGEIGNAAAEYCSRDSSLLATQSFAEREIFWRGSHGWGMGSAYVKTYNPITVETVSGVVISIDKITPITGMSYGIKMSVKTDKEVISVHVGPGWFVEHLDIKLEPQDEVEVKGSRITFEGKPAMIAAEVKRGSVTLKLRDENGFPAWSAGKRR